MVTMVQDAPLFNQVIKTTNQGAKVTRVKNRRALHKEADAIMDLYNAGKITKEELKARLQPISKKLNKE